MGTRIRTNGVKKEVSPANGKDYVLEEMQKIVGGFIEILDLGKGKIMVINEEGKFCCEPNPVATEIFRKAWKVLYGVQTRDYIAGDVLICKDEEVK